MRAPEIDNLLRGVRDIHEEKQQRLRRRICAELPALMLLELAGLPINLVRIVAQYYISRHFARPSVYTSIHRLLRTMRH